MENNHSQKTAIVTGGASGLGLAIAQKFADHNIRGIGFFLSYSDRLSRGY
jgi:NAD(P)-dependent dehydrogenase (short-subunit alcohol dehydrogenase family)